jgi:hypothetical protein
VYKTGKKRFIKDKRDFRLSAYMKPKIPTAPAKYTHVGLVKDFGVLGNDAVGYIYCTKCYIGL